MAWAMCDNHFFILPLERISLLWILGRQSGLPVPPFQSKYFDRMRALAFITYNKTACFACFVDETSRVKLSFKQMHSVIVIQRHAQFK